MGGFHLFVNTVVAEQKTLAIGGKERVSFDRRGPGLFRPISLVGNFLFR